MKLELIERIGGEFKKADGTPVQISDFSDSFISLRFFGFGASGGNFSYELFISAVAAFYSKEARKFNGIIFGNSYCDV